MKIIILGGGSIGSSVAKELSSEENDVVVIDNNKKNLEPLKSIEELRLFAEMAHHQEHYLKVVWTMNHYFYA